MTYQEALDLIADDKRGHTFVLASLAGGRKRYVRLDAEDGYVAVTLFRTEIARIFADRVELNTGGYETATTREAFNTILGNRGRVWKAKTNGPWAVYCGQDETYPFSESGRVAVPVDAEAEAAKKERLDALVAEGNRRLNESLSTRA